MNEGLTEYVQFDSANGVTLTDYTTLDYIMAGNLLAGPGVGCSFYEF